jgi:hypothetical protein
MTAARCRLIEGMAVNFKKKNLIFFATSKKYIRRKEDMRVIELNTKSFFFFLSLLHFLKKPWSICEDLRKGVLGNKK